MCGRKRSVCEGVSNCKFKTKEDGSPVNGLENINKSFEQLKGTKRKESNERTRDSAIHMGNSDIK